MIYKYTFEDGTVLRLLDVGLSVEEVWALEKLHGKLFEWSRKVKDKDG